MVRFINIIKGSILIMSLLLMENTWRVVLSIFT